MNYLEALKKLEEIEGNYDVESVRTEGVPVWPWLRLYLFQVMAHTKNEHSHDISAGKVKIVLRSLFAFNPLKYLKHHKVWLFNGGERRKEIKGKYIHRVSGFANSLIQDCFFIEKPSLLEGHHKKNEIEEKEIVSESWILLAVHITERFKRFRKLTVENEHIIAEILDKLGVRFDYRYFIRFLLAQRSVIKSLMRIAGRPDKVVIECPYTVMGYLWAFHDMKIKVIELQHGVAGSSHNAYVYHHPSIFYPDAMCVYGDREEEYFKQENPYYAKEIIPTGLYILEKCDKAFNRDPFAEYRERYDYIVVFAGQDAIVPQNIEFIKKVSKENPKQLFVFVPRFDIPNFPDDISNLLYKPGVNIYEYLKWCDIHCTVYSTTCLEAAYYNKPTIFYNQDNFSQKYYGDYLKKGNGIEYIDDPTEFGEALLKIKNCKEFKFPQAFVQFSKEKLSTLFC